MKILMLVKSTLPKEEINIMAQRKELCFSHFGNNSKATEVGHLLRLGPNTSGVL